MTDQQNSPTAPGSVENLEQVKFEESYEGDTIVFSVVIADKKTPDELSYKLTVTTVKPSSVKENQEIHAFVSAIRVGFTRLPEPIPVPGERDHPEPFNPKKQIKIEPTVHKSPQPGPIGVMVTVNTATGLGTWFGTRIMYAILSFYQDTVDPGGRDHIWTTPHGAKNLAKIHPTGGWGNIRWPVNNVRKVSSGNTTCVTTNRVRVHADKHMPYTFTGSWNHPPAIAP
jgi:hypothetical protein